MAKKGQSMSNPSLRFTYWPQWVIAGIVVWVAWKVISGDSTD